MKTRIMKNPCDQGIDKESLRISEHYNTISGFHDLIAKFPNIFGPPEKSYRKMAVNTLNLKSGDIVVDVGCGTGLNFELLEPIIGEEGKIIGVDSSPGMLNQAEKKSENKGGKISN